MFGVVIWKCLLSSEFRGVYSSLHAARTRETERDQRQSAYKQLLASNVELEVTSKVVKLQSKAFVPSGKRPATLTDLQRSKGLLKLRLRQCLPRATRSVGPLGSLSAHRAEASGQPTDGTKLAP
eukprot:scaffold108838_cov63-Phaeocystis_antarctica.AAC.4